MQRAQRRLAEPHAVPFRCYHARVLLRLRYKLSLRELSETFLIRGIVFSYEAVRHREAKLTPAIADRLRRRRRGSVSARATTLIRPN